MEIEQNFENNPAYTRTLTVFRVPLNSFLLVSFFGVMALSLDRFLVTYFHLRYQELVTQKRVLVGVISIWVFSAIPRWLDCGTQIILFSRYFL